ncbi:MAG: hypothetical protein CHACPFDD_03277 [Phycisphaerae bacterium]|nr:hypothetical protein [Phycisphaerae bacterium]
MRMSRVARGIQARPVEPTCRRLRTFCAPLAALAVLLPAMPAAAEILSIQGSSAVSVQEFRSGAAGDLSESFDDYPATSGTLPIRVNARLITTGDELAAAIAAAQFADPLTLDQPNPEEFAINLALNSLTPRTRYESTARCEEVRRARLSAADLPPLRVGQRGTIEGRLFLDGALAIYAAQPGRDLTGNRVSLKINIAYADDAGAEAIVFDGGVELNGAAGGGVSVSVEGDLPFDSLVLSDASDALDPFGVFHILIIPPLELPYTYSAVVGLPYTLRASIVVDAANVESGSGVAAVIGAPTDAIRDVVDATQGGTASSRAVGLLEQARADAGSAKRAAPAGDGSAGDGRDAAGETGSAPALCGLLGMECSLVPLALCALRAARLTGVRGRPRP